MPDYTAQLNQARRTRKVKTKSKESNPSTEITGIEFAIILSLAILKDLLDWILLFTAGIGLIVSRITTIGIAGILWLWLMIRLRKFPTKRFLGSFFIEMIPLIGTFSPTWTILIISIYGKQKGYLPKWIKKK